jgi:predicted ATPase/DNA-binding SARP family transcriptional activator
MSRLSLYFLGSPRIEKGDASVEIDRRKAIALLAYLAVAGKSHSRDTLASLLWPQYDQTNARADLRHTLSILKKALGEEWLDVGRETISLNRCESLYLDVDQFHSLLSQCRKHGHSSAETCPDCLTPLTKAVALYQDDFMAGFSLQDSSEFDDWQFIQAQSLRRELSSALERLVRCHGTQGELEKAIGYAERLLVLDPLHEPAHRSLMELYAKAGQQADALRQYRECERVLKKGLGLSPHKETVQLYEAIKEDRMPAAHLPSNKPPTAPSNNLPLQLTSFVGREREMEEVKRLLSTTPLLTLTGSGGCGKTRLAVEVAADLIDEFPDGVWLVEFASLSDPSLLPQAVASSLDVREQPGRSILATLSEYLKPKRLLLVLDNCEHLIEACATLSESLLRACPKLQILATSRVALGIAGELTYRVPSLSLPDTKQIQSISASDLAHYEAARLFIERATFSRPTFTVTDRDAPIVAQVCHRLDGIPLAIELAAARVKVLSIDQIAHRLDNCFQLLTGGNRTALPRHQTLRATMDWSYGLLSETEQMLLRRLSVFAGGWTLSAAEAVCADTLPPAPHLRGELSSVNGGLRGVRVPGIRPDEILDLLTQLVDKSLVLAEEQDKEARYRLLETVRQYGREKLIEAGEVEVVSKRHLDWYLSLAERSEPELRRPNQIVWFKRLEVERDNLRAALAWSLESEEVEAGLRLAGALRWFWFVRGCMSEGREWLEGMLSRSLVLETCMLKVRG